MNPRYRGRHQSVLGSRRQRGIAAVYAGVAIVALLASAALAVDVGQLYYAQREMQRSASLAALDGVQVASGCSLTSGTPGTLAQVASTVATSLATNDATSSKYNKVVPLLTAYPGGLPMVELGTTILSGSPANPALGTPANPTVFRVFAPLPAGSSSTDSVRVNLARLTPVPFVPFPGYKPAGGTLRASATAQQPAIGTFTLGTEVLNLNLQNSILATLLCLPNDTTCQARIIALNVAGSTAGLAQVGVSPSALGIAAGLSAQDLANPITLAATVVTPSEILGGLSASVGASADVSGVLQALASASTNPVGVPLGTLLGTVDMAASQVPYVDLMDLILALGESATRAENGGVVPIMLPTSIAIPNATANYTFLKIGAPPQPGTGPAGVAKAMTAEIQILVRSQLSLANTVTSALNGILGVLGTSISVSNINLGVDLSVAQASAFLDSLGCPGAASQNPSASLSAIPSLATLSIGTFSGVPSSTNAPPLSTGSAPLLTATVKAVGGLASVNLNVVLNGGAVTTTIGNTNRIDLPLPVTMYDHIVPTGNAAQPYYAARGSTISQTPAAVADNPQTVGSSGLFNSAFSTLTSSLAGNLTTTSSTGATQLCVLVVCVPLSSIANPLLNGVVSTITPVLTGASLPNGTPVAGVGTTLDSLVGDLLSALGAQVGTATVTMNTVTVAPPQLVTTCRPGTTDCS
jgi:uncharacterized membrane protein